MDLKVLYEDNHLLAVFKPAGILSQGDKTGDISMLDVAKDYIKKKYGKPGQVFMGLPHRLDRPVSGCLLMARTSKAHTRMSNQFRDRLVKKTYLAMTEQPLSDAQGMMKDMLQKDPLKNRSRVVAGHKGKGREAITKYRLFGKLHNRHLYKLHPLTGRPHQLRVQLMSRGAVICGDIKYGSRVEVGRHEICLHCQELTVEHPTKKIPIRITCHPRTNVEWRKFESLIFSI